MRPKRLGGMAISKITEIDTLGCPAGDFFVNTRPDTVARGREWLDRRFIERETIMIGFHSYVVQSNGRNILIDTCHGNDKRRDGILSYANLWKTDYLGNLAAIGLRPDDIDIVVCTHLHYDHVGWNTKLENGKWVPTFPNAAYMMTRADYEHFSRAPLSSREAHHLAAYQDSVLPIVTAGQAVLVESDHVIERELGEGVWCEGAPGHTPGSIVVHAKNADGHALFLGDVIHHPLQVMEPSLHVHGEMDSQLGTETRRRLLDTYADTDTYILTAHFPAPTAGRIVREGGNFRFQFEGE